MSADHREDDMMQQNGWIEWDVMGLRRRLCRMRCSPMFVIAISVGLVLLAAKYLRSDSPTSRDPLHNMLRDRTGYSFREWQQVGRNRKRIRFDDEDEQPFQVCRTPRLSLQNDANAHEFHKLPPLNCTVESLFFTRGGTMHLNESVLAGRSLDKCQYQAVTWENDNFPSFSEILERKQSPFEVQPKHDFFKVECFLKRKDNESKSKFSARKLLQLGSDGERIQKFEQHHVEGANQEDRSPKILALSNKPIHHSNLEDVKKDNTQQFHQERRGSLGSVQNVRPQQKIKGDDLPQKAANIQSPVTSQPKHEANVNINKPDAANVEKQDQQIQNSDNAESKDANNKDKDQNRLVRGQVKEAGRDEGNAETESKPDTAANAPQNEKEETNDRGEKRKEEDGDNEVEEEKEGENQTDSPAYDYDGEDQETFDMPDFEQYFVQVVPKEEVLNRIREITPGKQSTQMNVLMFALDSMSHLSYQRKMPKTYSYLKNTLGAVILNSYNIVGDATTAAIVPMLTGKTQQELPEVRTSVPESTYVDAYPLIWNRFEQNGYATLFSEDAPSLGVFNLRFNGFEEIPTDHYMRPFWQAAHKSNLYDISPRFCLGRTPRHQFLLDYMKDFHLAYSHVPTFSFNMLTEYTHGNNNPAQYVDDDVVDALETLRKQKALDNTLVIVFADHGARYSSARKTVQGKMEERLPMMSLTFPDWFKKKYPGLIRKLEVNANRLTTPFDIYETLRDVLDISRPNTPITHRERGISLLKEIPLNRTCVSAGIDMHWCTCMHWRPVDGFESEARQAATHIINYINSVTEKHRGMCHKLSLKRIEDAKMVFPNEKVLTFMKTIDGDQRIANFSRDVQIDLIHYQLIIETSPNGGLYESTVSHDIKSRNFKVSPDISRINLYGNQADCVEMKLPDLRKYCHCIRKKEET